MRGNETLLSICSPTATVVQGKPPDVSIPRPQPKSEGGSGLSAAAFRPSPKKISNNMEKKIMRNLYQLFVGLTLALAIGAPALAQTHTQTAKRRV
jgi:hypothetical protein